MSPVCEVFIVFGTEDANMDKMCKFDEFIFNGEKKKSRIKLPQFSSHHFPLMHKYRQIQTTVLLVIKFNIIIAVLQYNGSECTLEIQLSLSISAPRIQLSLKARGQKTKSHAAVSQIDFSDILALP